MTMRRIVSTALVALLGLANACRTGDLGQSSAARRPAVQYEVVFTPQDHPLSACCHGREMEKSLLDLPDGLLFIQRDSKLRVSVPQGREPHHCHVIHRVAEHLMDQVISLDSKGADAVTIDLSGFSSVEHVVITSAAYNASATAHSQEREQAVIPPYILSLKTARVEDAEVLAAVQDFRYDLKTPLGTASLFVQPLNRGDALLTVLDRSGQLSRLFEEDLFKRGYIYYRPQDAYVIPKVLVDVQDRTGRVFQRTGAWPVPARTPVDGEPFVLRTSRAELISFASPPVLTLKPATESPETAAQYSAVVTGAKERDAFYLVVAHTVPDDRQAKTFAFSVQTHELTRDAAQANAIVDLSALDSGRFPLTATVAHRWVAPFKRPGGLFTPRPALKTVVLASMPAADGAPKLHPNVISTARASHYDLLRFAGSGAAKFAGASIIASASSSTPGGPGSGPGSGPDGSTGPGPSLTPGGPGTTPGGSGSSTPTSGSATGAGTGPTPPPPGFGGGGAGGGGGGGGPAVGKIVVDLGCGCMMAGGCACPPHMWNHGDVMNHVMKYKAVRGPDGRTYEIADYHWYGSHGASAPCHQETLIGQVMMEWWIGMTLVRRTWDVYVTFTPCNEPPDEGKKKKGPGKIGDEDESQPKFDFGLDLFGAATGPEHPFNTPTLAYRIDELNALLGRTAVDGVAYTSPTRVLRFDPAKLRSSMLVSSAYTDRLKAEMKSNPSFGDPSRPSLTEDWPTLTPGMGSGAGQPDCPPPQPNP